MAKGAVIGGVVAVVAVVSIGVAATHSGPFSRQLTAPSRSPSPASAPDPSARHAKSPAPEAVPTRPQAPVAPKPASPSPPPGHFATRVIYVSDGDTYGAHLRKQGDIRVRIIGMDTPETKDPAVPPQCYGKRASKKLHQLLDGEAVTVAPQQRKFDDYHRWLLDTWLPDGRFVAALMIRGGFARTLSIPPNDAHAAYLARLERRAKAQHRGLWGACKHPFRGT